MKKIALLALSMFLTCGIAFADSPKDADPKPAKPAAPAKPKAAKKAEKSDSAISAEIEELRQAIQAQQEQLQMLKEELAKRDRQIDEAREEAAAANARAAEANSKATEAVNTSAEVKTTATTLTSTVGDLKASNDALKATVASEQAEASQAPGTSPLQLKIGDAYLTPVGFMDFTGVWRSRDGGSGIGTNFGGIPYGTPSAFATQLSEFRFSMQNSRIGFRVDADVKGSHVIGYMEADFLGNNPPNVAVSSNSNTLRSRLYWVDVRKGAWELLGGQTWSLATVNRVGVSPLPSDVFFSYNMDVNYQLGMVWGRIPEFRIAYHFPEDKAAFAVALDAPEQYAGGTNGSGAFTPPAALAATYPGAELNNGNTTLSVPNRAPDVIAKFVVDPSKRFHGEIGGLARFFQLYNPITATKFSTTGGGGFVNMDVGVVGGLRLLTHNFWSDGGGRYIFGQAPDLIARVDGSPSLVHASSTVDGFEFTHQNTTLFGYYGLVYIGRNVAIDANGCNIGWGFGPSSATLKGCTVVQSGQNRSIQEGTVGFIQNFWKNGKYGALSLIGQYSYLTRDPWAIAVGAPKNAHASLAFIDLRYTLPGSAPTLGKPGKE
jgi:hypothetical protein